MKKTLLSIAILASALVATSCSKENSLPAQETPRFYATIETGNDTRTTVERYEYSTDVFKYKTKWESGDLVKINGSNYDVTPDASDPGKAVFTLSMNQGMSIGGGLPTPPYKACFPASLYNGVKYVLPSSYTYADGNAYSEGKYNMPMYAESSADHFSFKNLCGVLAITVNGNVFDSVNSIEVSSDKQMNGEFDASADGVLSFKSVTLTEALKKVAITFTSAKTIATDGSATFYIPVPPGVYSQFDIVINSGGTPMTISPGSGIQIERNKVYPVEFSLPR